MLGDFVVVRTYTYTNLDSAVQPTTHLEYMVQSNASRLHTCTVLKTIGNCNTMVSIIILWDCHRICNPSLCSAYLQFSLPHLIKYAMTQIKLRKYKSNNIFTYFYWLYKQSRTATTDAPQFTRCLFTALRTIISDLQKSGCNSCSGILSLQSASVTSPEKPSTPFVVSLCLVPPV